MSGPLAPATPCPLPFQLAVNTGTSSDYRDYWTIGYNARYTVGVWAGNFDGPPMRGVSGITGAGPIFRDIFTWLHDRNPTPWIVQPPELVTAMSDSLQSWDAPPP